MNLSEPQEKRSGNEDDSVTYTTSGNTNPDPVILPVNPDEGRTGAEERERTSNNILRPSLITEFEGVEVETPEVVYGPEENPGP